MEHIDILNFTFLGWSIGSISKAALVIIMLSMGLGLTPSNFSELGNRPKPVLVGLAGQMLLLPAAGICLALAFDLAPEIALGLVIIAACPGGATSNYMTYLARGDVALSIVLTAISGLFAVVTVPAVVNFALNLFGLTEQGITLPFWNTVWNISMLTVLPVILGMGMRRLLGQIAGPAERILSLLSFASLMLVMTLILLEVWPQLGDMLRQAALPTVLLNVTMMAAGLGLSRLARLDSARGLTIAIEVGFQNYTLAIVIGLVMLQSPAMTLVPIVYLFTMYASAVWVVLWGRRSLAST